MVAFGFLTLAASAASAETRTLKLYFIHTKEKAEITFKRNGRYDQSGLQQINRFLRDWRRNEPTKMDPRLLDLVWEAYKASGSRDYIHVVSAYRSPATNSMLRGRSKGVANKSQHMLGRAMDFYLPDVRLKKLREIGLKMQAGGVGYYPTSGSPFVHFDVGNVRHWPRMSRKELVAVFPNGKTLHVPSDGKPLPGFEQAVAAYEARKGRGDLAIALASNSSGGSKRSGGLLAAFFGGGGGADDDEDSSPVVASAAPAPAPKAAVRQAPAAQAPAAKSSLPGIQILSPDEAQRADIPAADTPRPQEQTPETIIAALPTRNVPLPALAPRPQTEVAAAVAAAQSPEQVPFGMASAPLAETPAAPAQEVALNIPLPTRRPDYTPPSELATPAQQQAILLALAEPEGKSRTMADASPVPLPGNRPETADRDMIVAALPEARPALPEPANADAAANAAAVDAELKASHARVAALNNAAALRETVTERPASTSAAAAVDTGAKTTRKAARASAQDSKPDRKSVVVAAQPQAARWVLHNDYVTTASAGTRAPSFAYNIVRTAPREVYTAGFQAENQLADANRFSGKAVKFLTVARFQTH
ncbi:DUF882 domain-containing protein [Mesorhizobium sp. CGMCC 1.15528]|uniref:Murein endopeptidase K n=1 Tax=Mesorhizobium zhangyense TaxID=1776730 RepID=A0A7C9VG98_9HYPH|nr:DUF882 domain-containing protein [Mesorhizobium zhangyense]NGN44272.1 DUF882 domain-containing protein [Mesorhizobium zhangyense]